MQIDNAPERKFSTTTDLVPNGSSQLSLLLLLLLIILTLFSFVFQENSNGTVHYITESGSKSWDTDKITADGLQSADTQVDNNNIPMTPVRTDVGVSQSGLPIDVRTEVVAVNGQLHAGVNDIHDEDNSGEVDGCSEPQVTLPSPTRQTALQNPSTDNLVNPASRDCDNKQLPDAVVMKTEAKSGVEMDNSEHNSPVQKNHVYDNASFCDTETDDVSDVNISNHIVLTGSSPSGDVQTATSPTSDQTVSFDQVSNSPPRRSSVDMGLHSNPLTSIPEEGSEESGRAAQSRKPVVTIDNLSIADVGVICGDQRFESQAGKTTSSIKCDKCTYSLCIFDHSVFQI